MTAAVLTPAMRRFIDYFAELGPRWGLPAEACRVHACLYLAAGPVVEDALAQRLEMTAAALGEALGFLTEYRMIDRAAGGAWRTSGDPWDMLMRGLEQRRRRELPEALATLSDCHRETLGEAGAPRAAAAQMAKMLALAEDLAAIDAQAQRLSPMLLRGLVGLSGRAARFVDRGFRTRRGRP